MMIYKMQGGYIVFLWDYIYIPTSTQKICENTKCHLSYSKLIKEGTK